MKILRKMLKLFISAGVEEEEFVKVEKEFSKINRTHLKYYCTAVVVFYLILAAANIITGFFNNNNTYIYLATAAAMLIIGFSCIALERHKTESTAVVDLLTYGFMSVLYLSSIVLSLNHPEMPAVSYIGVLIVLPLLFAARPINIAMHQLVFVVLFCILVNIYKTPFIAGDDTWNVVSFYAVSLIATAVVMPMRVRNILNLTKLAYLSEHDILTDVKNRNSFEIYTEKGRAKAASGICCIYADVNGLHELNNKKGHAAGDEMLKTAAKAIKEVFGEENTYRVGGDEFVAFSEGFDEYELREKLKEITIFCEKQDYYLSFGFAGPWDKCDTMSLLVSLAEAHMFEAKREFYREHTEFDRRR